MADQPFHATKRCGAGRRSGPTSASSFGPMCALLGFSLLAAGTSLRFDAPAVLPHLLRLLHTLAASASLRD